MDRPDNLQGLHGMCLSSIVMGARDDKLILHYGSPALMGAYS